MSYAREIKKGKRPEFNVVLSEDVIYKKMKDMDRDTEYTVEGFYIRKSDKYKTLQPHAIINCNLVVTLPTHRKDDVIGIMNDTDDVADINAGKFFIKFYEYESKDYGKQLDFELVIKD